MSLRRKTASNRIRRRCLLESLEDRRLLAFGDLLATYDTPSSLAQAGAQAGFSISGGRLGTPLYDVTKNGVTYNDAGRITIGSASIDNPIPHAGDQFGYASA